MADAPLRKPVVGFEGFYEVDDQGRVFSVARKVMRRNGTVQTWEAREMRQGKACGGDPVVRLSRPDFRIVAKVHHLVAKAFLPNPKGLPEIKRKDGNRKNTKLANLEWSQKEFLPHAIYLVDAEAKTKPTVFAPDSKMTSEVLRSLVFYSKDTGLFTCRKTAKILGGSSKQGYVFIGKFGKSYPAHRLAWLYVHGEWPSKQIDHRNGIPSDNRFDNLRLATYADNSYNKEVTHRVVDLPRGVIQPKTSCRFHAEICHARRTIHLGTFATAEEAGEFYELAAEMLHGEFAYHLRQSQTKGPCHV